MNWPLAATPAAWKLVMAGLVLAMAANNTNSSSSNTIIDLNPHVEAHQKLVSEGYNSRFQYLPQCVVVLTVA